MNPTTFGSVLVANRGEIAVRILRAARAADLRTVAVYSDADRTAPHVREADTAVRLGPAPAAESYLSIPALLRAAERTGAEAVHPGYGFLSERAEFARACADAGLVFVGPPADVIELMGRKDEARRVAVAAGVPVVPAVAGSEAELRERAVTDFRYPLLVKAAAGGGGKGMRVVRHPDDLAAAVAAAKREALSAFGDDTVLLEQYVERGRHVEVQVVADAFGTVIHLFDRDCSVQRRHQKVIEEAPAPTIPGQMREVVTSAAVRLAREVGYVNAGTVEFLVAGDGSEQRAYFLEMNTRLQVEHPVTECVTGIDLVRLQFDIAQGRPLPIRQGQVTVTGHAMEARVYAEDPSAGFLPQAGLAQRVRWSPRARVDAALDGGQRVGTWYDPLLGKVIVHRATREAARRALVDALDDTAILGLTTNLGFLRRLAASAEYRDAAIDTAWLDRHPEAFPPASPDVALCAAAWALAGVDTDPHDPFAIADGWRAAAAPADVLVELAHRGNRHVLRVDRPGGVVAELAATDQQVHRRWAVHEVAADRGLLRLEIDGLVHEVLLEADRHRVTVGHRGDAFPFVRPDVAAATAAVASGDGLVIAPMPGTVLAVHVEKGSAVVAGEVLAVLEAMKMELPLRAPFDGAVDEVTAAAGQQVPLGQALFTVVPHAPAEEST
ncbi:MAG: Carbamoyl-phosphate synthase chain, ATP-binding protein [Pseudonocardia sp.]|nr:Carbamoyl-phosphate synthase chain, ATP-binding protein [Pseudonocardia sp.]